MTPGVDPLAALETVEQGDRRVTEGLGQPGTYLARCGRRADVQHELRKGGPEGLAERGTAPDYGPAALHPTAGATLVSGYATSIAADRGDPELAEFRARMREGTPRLQVPDLCAGWQEGGTLLSYTAKATIGGKLAQVGSRLVDGVAKKLAGEFFASFTERVSGKASS